MLMQQLEYKCKDNNIKFIEKEGNFIIAEMKAVFWSHNYTFVEEFEKLTKQIFANGLEITCEVKIRFHARYGLDVEVFSFEALCKAALNAKRPEEREHVTVYFYRHPEIFNLINLLFFLPVSISPRCLFK